MSAVRRSDDAARDITVSGNATPEEVAAVVAAFARLVTGSADRPAPDGYERWRSGRLAALRHER